MKHLICTIIFLCAPLWATAQSQEDEDKGYITSLIEENLSGVSREVNILGFQGALSSEATIEVLTIADEEGVWLSLENITLSWTRSALLRGAIDIQEISAEKIVVSRPPISEETGPSPEAQPFSLPELPVSIDLEQLAIGRLELGEVFLGEPIAISLQGSASLSGGEGVANVVAERLGDKRGIFEIDGSYANETGVLGLLLNLEEGEDGIAARILDLPGRPAIGLRVEGEAPVNDYEATLAIATDGEDRLNGTFRLTEDPAGRLVRLDVGGDVSPLFDPAYRSFFGTDSQLFVDARQTNDGRIEVSSLNLESQRLNLAGALLIGAQGWPERIRLSGGIVRGSQPVLLPVAGPETYVAGARIAINYDNQLSDDWTAEITIDDFDRPGLFIDELGLTGGGILRNGEGAETGLITANLNYGAEGLRLDDAGAAQALGDAVTGRFSASRTEGEPTEISQLTLSGAGINVEAEATVLGVEEGLETDATANLSVAGLGRFSSLVGRDLGGAAEVAVEAVLTPLDGLFDVTLNGTTDDLAVGIPEADAVLAGAGTLTAQAVRDTTGTRLESLRVTTSAAEVTAQADLTSDGSDASFTARLNEVSLVLPDLNGAAFLRGNARLAADGVIDFSVAGTGPSAQLSANGTVNPAENGQTINAAVTADIADLTTYAALADRPLSGAANLAIDGVLLSDGLRFDVDVQAETQDVTTGIARLDPFLDGAGTLSAAIARPTQETFLLSDLDVSTPILRATGNVGIDAQGPLESDLNLRITDASAIDPNLSGPVTAAFTATPEGDESLRMRLRANGPDVTIAADTVLNKATNEISGDVSADLAELAAYQSLVGQPISGQVSLNVSGAGTIPQDGEIPRFDFDLQAETQDVTTGIARVDPFLVGTGTLSGNVASPSDGTFTLSDLTIATPLLRATGNAGFGPDGPLESDLNLRITDASAIDPNLSGPVSADFTAAPAGGDDLRIRLNANGIGAVIAADTLLDRPSNEISGDVSANIADLATFRPIVGQPLGGRVDLTASGSILPDLSRFDAQINLQTRDLRIGNPTVDVLLRGAGQVDIAANQSDGTLTVSNFEATTPQFSVTGALNGAEGTGEGWFDATLRDVGILTDQVSGPARASGTAQLDATGNWRIDASGTGPGGLNAQVNGQVGSGGQLDLDVTGSAPLALANTAIEPRRLSGTANFDMSVNGLPGLDALGGRITIANGRLAAPTLAQALTDIGGQIGFSNGRARLDLRANVEAGGGLTIIGPVDLEGPNNADITANVRDVRLRDPELYSSSIAGTVSVTGPLQNGARIVGRLELGRTDIRVPSSSVSTLGDLPEVRHIGAGSDVTRTLQRAGLSATPESGDGDSAGPATPGFPLDVVINAPSRIFVRGRGLDAELGGRLSIGGTTNDVVPVGRFELIRGRIDILQQRFDLTEGSATLQGDFDPYIRLVATTQTDNGTTVNIIVEGPAGEPEVRFESVPELPQDEVLSQLIFGRDLESISPLQAVQLASAISTLAGQGGGAVDRLRRNIGLDDFDITTDEEGQTAVRAGRYLSENVYTDVVVNSEGDTEINLNLDVTNEITAKGSVDQDGETSIGIFFERDY
ncbi:translocation/assembly module TamB domain-containing protein [Yoonia sp. 2307UL14-13]|uniref:translocation/assembly module TamB domain-containing protein n=1 Tax=Yoonia sp. 2307UL14-13 TaxID=3126506 RepID=UPI0030ADEEB9